MRIVNRPGSFLRGIAVNDTPDVEQPARDPSAEPPKTPILAEQLLAGRQEVVIELKGECYRLRLTRRGRLPAQRGCLGRCAI